MPGCRRCAECTQFVNFGGGNICSLCNCIMAKHDLDESSAKRDRKRPVSFSPSAKDRENNDAPAHTPQKRRKPKRDKAPVVIATSGDETKSTSSSSSSSSSSNTSSAGSTVNSGQSEHGETGVANSNEISDGGGDGTLDSTAAAAAAAAARVAAARAVSSTVGSLGAAESAFANDVVLITGAGRGIGRALALAFGSMRPLELLLVSRGKEDLGTITEQVKTTFPAVSVVGITCDLADAQDCAALARQVIQHKVTVLVNNAGIAFCHPVLPPAGRHVPKGNASSDGPAVPREPVADLAGDLDRTMAVNVRAPMVLSQALGLGLQQRGPPYPPTSIVNVSSQASAVGLLNHTTYCASKAALDSLTRTLALELGSSVGTRVNSVLPTVVLTELGEKNWSDPAKAKPMLARIPLGQFASINDVTQPVLFLADHEKARMITGSCLPIDGGFLASPFS